METFYESLERERVSGALSVLLEAIYKSLESESESEWGTFHNVGGHLCLESERVSGAPSVV